MPSRKHSSYKLLPERYAATLARIISNLESVSVLSVTVDVWINQTTEVFLKGDSSLHSELRDEIHYTAM